MAEGEKKMGRPRIEFDRADFLNLLDIGASEKQIQAWFARKLDNPNLSADTIQRYCKREFEKTFAALAEERKENCKTRVMQAFYKKLPTSDALIIFGMKNLCGWKDNPDEVKAPAEPIRVIIEKIPDDAGL